SSSIRLMQFINPTLGFAGGAGGVFLRYGNSIGITQINSELPSEYKLGQNYPNPFNPSTTIDFSVPVSGEVTLKIYDLTGKEVSALVNEFRNAGNYSVNFNAASVLNSGIYFYKLTSGNISITKKFMIVK
ncbi:MAG: T9SS type A sorting domain-containing protein, partial [Ignavibacteria bacterium]